MASRSGGGRRSPPVDSRAPDRTMRQRRGVTRETGLVGVPIGVEEPEERVPQTNPSLHSRPFDAPVRRKFTGRYHTSLVGGPSIDGHVEQMLELREYIDDLPETAATFKVSGKQNCIWPGSSDIGSEYRIGLLAIVGTWPTQHSPVGPSGNQRSWRWVNPRYEHRSHYADVYARCPCGAIVSELHERGGGNSIEELPQHASDCPDWARYDAKARLSRLRAVVLRSLLFRGHSPEDIAPRCNVSSRTLRAMSEGLGITRDQRRWYRNAARTRKINTATILFHRGASATTVASVFGIPRQTFYNQYVGVVGMNPTEVMDGGLTDSEGDTLLFDLPESPASVPSRYTGATRFDEFGSLPSPYSEESDLDPPQPGV